MICLGIDLPAILDHDDDGDLDIITFTETATTLYRFEGQTPCGLDLVCTNRCYGMLEEASENNALFIGDDFECDFNVKNPGIIADGSPSRTGLHTGGAITSLQLEAGGPKDLLISDVTYPEILGIVMETASNSLDSAVYVDPTFPANLYTETKRSICPNFQQGITSTSTLMACWICSSHPTPRSKRTTTRACISSRTMEATMHLRGHLSQTVICSKTCWTSDVVPTPCCATSMTTDS